MDGLEPGEVEPCHLPRILHSLATLRQTSSPALAEQILRNTADILPRWSRVNALLDKGTT